MNTHNQLSNNVLPNGHSIEPIEKKIQKAVLDHAYYQGTLGFTASLLSTTIILIGLFHTTHPALLITWYVISNTILLFRYLCVKIYFTQPKLWKDSTWLHLFSLGAWCSGLSWGFLGSFLLPYENMAQLCLTLFVLAGVTSGAVPLLSGIRSAIIGFLICSLTPTILCFMLIQQGSFALFSAGMFIYFTYLVILAIKTHSLIKNSIGLQFDNDLLLHNLSTAKKELEDSNTKLEHAAQHDYLTNLTNRGLFEKYFENAIWQAQQDQTILALLYLDLDKFKEVNDAYGHHIGDLLLQKVVERIKRKLPENVLASRLGGDEFTIIIKEVVELDNIAELCNQICEALQRPFDIKEYNLYITTSIGVSVYPIDGRDPEMLLKNADKSMYICKQKGGNGFHFNTELAIIKTTLDHQILSKQTSIKQ